MNMFSTINLLMVSAIVVTGCNSQSSETVSQKKESTVSEKSTVTFDNTHCPIMLAKVDPESVTTNWQGKTIGYCCDECKDAFEKLSDEDKKKALAKAEKEGIDVDHDDLEHDHSHEHGHEHDDHNHDKKAS